jgi:hypothetical protein
MFLMTQMEDIEQLFELVKSLMKMFYQRFLFSVVLIFFGLWKHNFLGKKIKS